MMASLAVTAAAIAAKAGISVWLPQLLTRGARCSVVARRERFVKDDPSARMILDWSTTFGPPRIPGFVHFKEATVQFLSSGLAPAVTAAVELLISVCCPASLSCSAHIEAFHTRAGCLTHEWCCLSCTHKHIEAFLNLGMLFNHPLVSGLRLNCK
ncbi:unnamed protein product [Pylaiella littoralis]